MLYSRLIKSLIEESVAAKLGGYDIADALRGSRDTADTIRKALIYIACDERFRRTVKAQKGWRMRAQEDLEELAALMDNDTSLNEGKAILMAEKFITQFFLSEMNRTEEPPKELPPSTEEKKEEIEKDLDVALEKLGEHFEGSNPTPDKGRVKGDPDDNQSDNQTNPGNRGRDGEDKPGKKKQSRDDDEEEAGTLGGQDEDSDEKDEKDVLDGSGHNRLSPEREKKVETQFMRSIPRGLRQLAKRIGRAGNDDSLSSGHFLTAAKSDIVGITVGNELGSLLPSEIATLSCPETQNVFFKNYVEKKLQVFASASGGNVNTPRHDDGPIIICLDSSGSMTGKPANISRALTIAVCIIAQRRHRKVLIVKYSHSHSMFRMNNLRRDMVKILDFLSRFEGGGNDENTMFGWLFRDILPEQGDFRPADVLCISDFGWEFIDDDIMRIIKENKAKGMKFYGLDVTDSFRRSQKSAYDCESDFWLPQDVIDEMWLWHVNDARPEGFSTGWRGRASTRRAAAWHTGENSAESAPRRAQAK